MFYMGGEQCVRKGDVLEYKKEVTTGEIKTNSHGRGKKKKEVSQKL